MAEVYACQVEVLDGSTVSIDVNVSFCKIAGCVFSMHDAVGVSTLYIACSIKL